MLFLRQLNRHTIHSLFEIAIPAIISYILESVVDIVVFHFLGQLADPIYLGAAGLGSTWTNITSMSIIIGYGTALQTLCSQSMGSNDYYMCGTYHLRARFVVLLIGVPISLTAIFSESIFLLLGIDPTLSHYSCIFAIYMIPTSLIYSQADITKLFLLTQNIKKPIILGMIVMTIPSPFVSYFFINYLDLKLIGAAIAKLILNTIKLLFLIIYINSTGCCGKAWFFFNRDSFRELGIYIRYGTYGALMLCLEWWSWEIINAMAARLGTIALATNVVLLNMATLIYRASVGIQVATSTLVGNEVGKGNIQQAKNYCAVSFCINSAVSLGLGFLFIIFRAPFSWFFSNDKEVNELLNVMIFFVVTVEFSDCLNGLFQNILIGVGKQHIATVVNLVAYYVFVIPLAYLLTFALHMNILGIWLAYETAVIGLNISYGIVVYRLDWPKIVSDCKSILDDENSKLVVNKSESKEILMKTVKKTA